MRDMSRIEKIRRVAATVVASATVMATATGCLRDELQSLFGIGSDVVCFTTGGRLETKAACNGAEMPADTRMMLLSEDGKDTLWMRGSVNVTRTEDPAPAKRGTKGAPVTTDNLKDRYTNSVYMAAFNNDGTSFIPSQQIEFKKFENPKYIWRTKDHDYLWPDDGTQTVDFWAWAPHSATVAAGCVTPKATMSASAMSFDYTVPVSSEHATDAEVQNDILVAQQTIGRAACGGKAPLEFQHALSAIRFEVGKTNACTIKSVALGNLYGSGTCTATAVDGSVPAITWNCTGISKTASYSQTFGDVVPEYLIDDDHTVTIGTEAKTFFVIPQNLDGVTVTVVYQLEGTSVDITVSAPLKTSALQEWLPGYTYTYVLGIINGLDIEIDDVVSEDGLTKDNLTIQNVGGKPAYVRALITGYWVNGSGDIVALWDPANTTMGTFTPAIFAATPVLNEYWVKGDDGFFYYTKILPAGQETETKLFNSYVVNESGKPKNLKLSDHLEIDIVSQAVVADAGKAAITTAWGATAAGYMTE